MSSRPSEPLSRRELLDRAVEAEAELESARGRATELESRLRAVLLDDPEVAHERAVSWMNRAINAEKMLGELVEWLHDNPSVAGLLPTGFDGRLSAQLQAVEVSVRDFGGDPDSELWESHAGQPQVVAAQPRERLRGEGGTGMFPATRHGVTERGPLQISEPKTLYDALGKPVVVAPGGEVNLNAGDSLTFTHQFTME